MYLLPNLESTKGQLTGMQSGFWRSSELVFPEEFKQERGMVHLARKLVLGVKPSHHSAGLTLSEKTF